MSLTPANAKPATGDDPAVAAARARQQAVKTLVIEFKLSEQIITPKPVPSAEKPLRPGEPDPLRQVTLESINKLVLDGEKIRYEDKQPAWSLPSGRTRSKSKIEVFDGARTITFYSTDNGGNGGPVATVENKARVIGVHEIKLSPIKLAFRGLSAAFMSHPLNEWKPSGDKLVIDGATCRKYTLTVQGQETSYWLDEGKDFVIRRVERRWGDQRNTEIDITYRHHEVCGWGPSSWTFSIAGPGSGKIAGRVDVVAIKINEPQPAELFGIVFPVGCLVHKDGKTYRLKAGEGLQELDPVTGQELLPTVPPSAADSWPWKQGLAAVLGVAILAIVAAFVVRKRRPQDSPAPQRPAS